MQQVYFAGDLLILQLQAVLCGRDFACYEFMNLCNAVLPTNYNLVDIAHDKARAAMQLFCLRVYAMLDSKKQGHVGFRELTLLTDVLVTICDRDYKGKQIRDDGAVVDWVFQLYDLDDDGEIDCVELRTMLTVSGVIQRSE